MPVSSPQGSTPTTRRVPTTTPGGTSASTATPPSPATFSAQPTPDDRFVSGASSARAPHEVQGLPALVLDLPHAKVQHGDDPGNFYCEHAFFLGQHAAEAPGSVVARNEAGERLVGFLHVPHDGQSQSTTAPKLPQDERHRANREVVGSALRGYVDEARRTVDGPIRVLLTGYGAWGSTVDNPTGDFVSHPENVDAAMQRAFGRDLVGAGRTVSSTDEGALRAYVIREPSGGTREVLVQTRLLPVTDAAIDGGPRSLQREMDAFRPHAVLSMGVMSTQAHRAEHKADDGGMRDALGTPAHDAGARPSTTYENWSLARAIHRGARAATSSQDDALAREVRARRTAMLYG